MMVVTKKRLNQKPRQRLTSPWTRKSQATLYAPARPCFSIPRHKDDHRDVHPADGSPEDGEADGELGSFVVQEQVEDHLGGEAVLEETDDDAMGGERAAPARPELLAEYDSPGANEDGDRSSSRDKSSCSPSW